MTRSCNPASVCLFAACDDFVDRTLRGQFQGFDFCWHNEAEYGAAERQLQSSEFALVFVEISFDGGRVFELLRSIRKGKNAKTKIVCFRGRAPKLGRLYCDDAIAAAAAAVASAEYVDLSVWNILRTLELRQLVSDAVRAVPES